MVDHIENTWLSLCMTMKSHFSGKNISPEHQKPWPQTNEDLAFHSFPYFPPQVTQNQVRLLLKAFQSHDDWSYQLIEDYKVNLFIWNTAVVKNNVSEVRERFLDGVS